MSRVAPGAGCLLLACLMAFPLFGQAPFRAIEGSCDHASHAIDVQVHGVRSDHGYVTFALYGDNPDDFLVKGRKIFQHRFSAKRGTMAFCILLPAPGTYAAAAYHDENGNTKFDRNWVGFPKEAFGVSNNPDYWVIPSHAEAAFHVHHDPTRIAITLKY